MSGNRASQIPDAVRRPAFQDCARQALEGKHLPTIEQLLRGCPFCNDDINQDARAFAKECLPRMRGADPLLRKARAKLKALASDVTQSRCDEAAEAIGALLNVPAFVRELSIPDAVLRCNFYSGSLRSLLAAWRIADAASSYVRTSTRQMTRRWDMQSPLRDGCSMPCAGSEPGSPWHWVTKKSTYRTQAETVGSRMVERMMQVRQRLIEDARANRRIDAPFAGEWLGIEDLGKEDADNVVGIVVFSNLGNADIGEGRKIGDGVRDRLVGRKLPLLPVPVLSAVHRELVLDFPHAEAVVTRLLDDLASRMHVSLRPTLLLGNPGSGKTTFASSVLAMLGVPHCTFSCGGVANSALAGTARRWSTGEPSLPGSCS